MHITLPAIFDAQIMRRLISIFAKIIYKEKYKSLQKKLLLEYLKIDNSNELATNVLSQILISGEDHRFKYHIGFDIYAIFRAIKNRFIFNKIEGASTIEQQIVRVLTNEYKKSLTRKIQEILLSTTLASNVPKKHLPVVYLNIAYYGTNLHGLNSILERLNIQSTENISLEKAAEIVSRIKYPEPNRKSLKRETQIEMRKLHLIHLHQKHSNRKFFKIYE